MSKKNRPDESFRKRVIHVVSLGCPKNQVDSEKLIGQLSGHVMTDDPRKADTIIINTCGFIDSAKEESVREILAAVKLKDQSAEGGNPKEIIVMGCLSQRYGMELKKEIPEVDRFYGVRDTRKIVSDLGHQAAASERLQRKLLNPGHFAYLKISDGCNHRCGFCAIPSIRGRLVSEDPETLIAEAGRLAETGVKELILVSQDTTAYGFDRIHELKRDNRPLIRLLEKLHTVSGLKWIRLMYFYPTLISEDLLKAMGELPKICPYIDVPVQHISDRVLKRMRRGTPPATIRLALERIRRFLPGAAVRTSVIVGHPGETRKDFLELCAFVRDFQFDRLGVFPYSKEDGTYSYRLKPQVAGKIRQERFDELMALQQPVSYRLNQEKVGRTIKVLVDRKEDNTYFGRTVHDAPEIDHEVIISEEPGIYTGQFSDIDITDAYEYDLVGRRAGMLKEIKTISRSL